MPLPLPPKCRDSQCGAPHLVPPTIQFVVFKMKEEAQCSQNQNKGTNSFTGLKTFCPRPLVPSICVWEPGVDPSSGCGPKEANMPGCQPRKRGWACTGFRKPLEEGKLQSDSGVLWNMLEDLNLLIFKLYTFPPCDRSLVLWHNGVTLTASWELTFRSTFDTDCLPVFKASQFLRAVVKCQSGGYKLLSICHFQCNGAAFTWEWSCISETQNMISPVRFFF